MAKRKKKFKTEVQQLLDLVIHSLYSKKEIFLRELISNASDAIDRAQFEALTDKSILDHDPDWKIRIAVDKDARTITVSDNGIGMSPQEVETNIGTIANSGTRSFLENLQKAKDDSSVEFIGQFGVGFYSSFMVAVRVEILTRRAGKDQVATRWSSDGSGSYSIGEGEREGRGTDVIIHLREGMDEFMEEWKIRSTVKHYSDYIGVPIVMGVERTQPASSEGEEETTTVEEETLNSMKAIWKKAKSEISKDEYNEFYKHVSHDYADPLRVIHYVAEGTTEFRALAYIPSKAPFGLFLREERKGLHLYVKNVFITDDCKELLPEYLRFVKGVVDSSDLPLNISREILQDDAIIRRIRKNLIGRILSTIADIKKKGPEDYRAFYAQFGRVLKEGLHTDFENADKLKELLLFHSTATEDGAPVSLRDYVDRMPEGQEEVYFITAESLDAAAASPHLEALKARDYEVLFLCDPIDEWIAPHLAEYDGKKLRAVNRGDIELGTEEEKKETEAKLERKRKDFGPLLDLIRSQLQDDVKEVKLSSRLTDSACCLVADENGLDANMERIMRAMDQDVPHVKRTLEVNPSHPVLKQMRKLFETSRRSRKLKDYVELLYAQALITEGSQLKDPLRFSKLVSDLMAEKG